MLPAGALELVWTKGEPVLLKASAHFLRKGMSLALDPGNVLVPLEDSTARRLTKISGRSVYVWSFLLPDGSVTEFFLDKNSYSHTRGVDNRIAKDLKTFFGPNEK